MEPGSAGGGKVLLGARASIYRTQGTAGRSGFGRGVLWLLALALIQALSLGSGCPEDLELRWVPFGCPSSSATFSQDAGLPDGLWRGVES